MKLLFICKYNRFRSKVAEAIFNKLNKNKKIKAKSAGLTLDNLRPYIEPNVIKIMKEKGYIIKGKPEQLIGNMIKKFDTLIIVSNDIDKKIFQKFKGKIISWNIEDCNAAEINKIKKIINKIETKVKKFISTCNK